jgi:autotransporter-associated beta strand protein
MTGTNNWGQLDITEGRVQIGDGGATGSLPLDKGITIGYTGYSGVNWNGQLVFNSKNSFSISGTLLGATAATYAAGVATYTSGSNPGGVYLADTNTGKITLTGDNSFYGAPYNVDGGALVFGNAATDTFGSPLYLGVGGGTNAGVVKLDSAPGIALGGAVINKVAPWALYGRSTAANPHIENVSGANVIGGPTGAAPSSGPISLMEGGNQYVIQSDAGVGNSLTIAGNIENDAGAGFTDLRYLTLQGTGNGEVSGIIGGGSNPAALHVIKTGGGTWTLSNANTYTGNTTVNAGTLSLGATGSIDSSAVINVNGTGIFDATALGGAFTVGAASSQILGGTGTVKANANGVVNGAFGTIAPGGDLTAGTLTIGTIASPSKLTLGNVATSTIKFDLSNSVSGTNDLLVVNGGLTNPGGSTFAFNMLNNQLQTTTGGPGYKLITYTAGVAPAVNTISLTGLGSGTTRQVFSLSNATANEIDLVVSGNPATLTWLGTAGNTWNRTLIDWYRSSPLPAGNDKFYNLDMVTFDDTGAGGPEINITLANLAPGPDLQPASMTFANNNKNYTLSGAGSISGGTGLNLTGSGKVTLANSAANTFTGAINITGSGTLQIGDGTNSGAIPNTLNILDNGTLIFDRPAADVFTYSGLISGTGAFVQQGGSTTTMSAANSYSGSTSILGGTLIVSSLANGGSNSNIGSSSNAASNLVISGGTLQYMGAAISTNRLFTLGASGATIDSSGTGALNFSNTGTMLFTGSGARTLTLRGTNASGEQSGTNTIWAVIGNGSGGGTSIFKTDAGRWALAGNNTFSGTVTVDNGMLWSYTNGSNGNPQTFLYNTALGASTNTVTINSGATLELWSTPNGTWQTNLAGITLNGGTLMSDDGHQAINSPVNFTADSTITTRWWDKELMINGPVTGAGNLTINATLPGGLSSGGYNYGTVILAGNANSWTGTTTITAWTGTNQGRSTLQIGNAGVGSLPVTAANAISLASGATLAFNTTNDITITDAAITGAGFIANQGSGTITLSGNNPGFTGILLTGAGSGVSGLYYGTFGLTTNPALNNGALRVTNSIVWGGSSSTYWAALAGGNSTSRLELGGGATDVTTPTTLCWLNGRNPDITAPILVSVSRNNTIAGTVELGSGGNTYIIESQTAGDTLTFNATNAIGNDNNNTTARYLTLKGAGNFTVNGIVGGDATYPTRTNVVLNKSGNGTLTLNGVNTYTGNTTINGGTLALGQLGAPAVSATIVGSPVITVNTGATFDVTGTTTGGMTLGAAQTLAGSGTVRGNITTTASGSTLSPGGSIGTLTFNNDLTLAGKDNINYEVSGTGDDLISVLGTMTLNGDSAAVGGSTATNLNFGVWGTEPALGNHQVAGAAINLVAAAGNNAVTVVNPTRYTVTAAVTPGAAGRIDVTVAGTNSTLTWAGAVGSTTWDVATTSPWTGGAALDNKFYQADRVIFGDYASPQTTVTVSTTVKPLSVTVNGSNSYTFSGTGKISGSTGFAMNGTGTVTLATTNDYYGATSVTAGTLNITGSIGPNSPLSITGGTVKVSNAVALGDNSQFITAATTIDGGTTLAPGGTLDINGTSSLSLRDEPIFVKGVGVGTAGAIINTGASVTEALHYVTMQGDTTLGGTGAGRMDIGRWTAGGSTTGYLRGNNYILTKTGPNDVWLNNLGTVNLKGLVVNGGELTIEWDNALVGTVLYDNTLGVYTPITINAGGQFGMWGRPTSDTPLYVVGAGAVLYSNVTLNGGGIGGTQTDTQAAQTYAGTINLTANSQILAATPSNTSQRCTDTYFTGKITGNGNLTKPATFVIGTGTIQDGGALYFTGNASNTYNGATIINGSGFLYLQKTGAIAIPGNLTIAPASGGTTVSLGAAQQIADTGVVSFVGASGNQAYLDLMGFNETVGGISDSSGNGVIELYYYGSANNSTFTVKTAASTSYSFNGIMRDKATGTPTGTLSLVKDGPGTQILTGSNITYTGNTTVLGGILDVPNLNTPNSDVTVAAGSNVLIATSIVSKTLTIGAGGEVIIRAISGGPTSGSGSSLAPVPEPATWAMLMLAAMGLGIYWRRSR